MIVLKKIILIDDDEDDRAIFIEALNEAEPECEVITASNGKAGLSLLQEVSNYKPDILFLDLNMPIMNGIQCLVEIRKINSLSMMPVVIYTTSWNVENKVDIELFKPVYILLKPAIFRDIVHAIKGLKNHNWKQDYSFKLL